MDFKVYFTGFFISFILTVILTVVAYHIGFALGIVDEPEYRKIHTTPIPRSGGIAIFISIIAAIVITHALFPEVRETFKFKKDILLKGKVIGEIKIIKLLTGVFFGSLLIFVMGVVDDIKKLKASHKLLLQIISSYIAMDYGVRISGFFLPNKGYIELPLIISQIFTVIFIVSFVNAFNLIDGLDGLATGIAWIVFFSLFLIAVIKVPLIKSQEGIYSMKTLSIVSIIALASATGFLIFNFHPAKIFLGDSGSNLLGFIIAAISISFTTKTAIISAIIIPFIVAIVPFIDTIFTILRRAGSGKSIYLPDKKHIHHILLKKLSHREAVLLLYNLSFIAAIIGLGYSFVVIK